PFTGRKIGAGGVDGHRRRLATMPNGAFQWTRSRPTGWADRRSLHRGSMVPRRAMDVFQLVDAWWVPHLEATISRWRPRAGHIWSDRRRRHRDGSRRTIDGDLSRHPAKQRVDS